MASANNKSKTNNTRSTTAKNTAKSSRSREQKNKQKQQYRQLAGVLVMFLGIIAFLWTAFVFSGNFSASLSVPQWLGVACSLLGNLLICLIIAYLGYLLFTAKQHKLGNWSLIGAFFFLGGILGVFHWKLVKVDINTAFAAALNGDGGGLFGFIPAFLLNWASEPTAKIILISFVVLGLILATNFKIFVWLALGGRKFINLFFKEEDADDDNLVEEKQAADKHKSKKAVKGEDIKDNKNSNDESLPGFTVAQSNLLNEKRSSGGRKATPAAVSPLIVDYAGEPEPVKVEEPSDLHNIMPKISADFKDNDADSGIDNSYKTSQVKAPDYDKADALGLVRDVKEQAAVGPIEVKADDVESHVKETSIFTGEKVMIPVGDPAVKKAYVLPPSSLLADIGKKPRSNNQEMLNASKKLVDTLASFGVKAEVVQVVSGPAVTRYELQPAPGVKVSKIVNLADDIALAMAAKGLRIEAPVPGKAVIGIEIAKGQAAAVHFKEVLTSKNFIQSQSKISLALGIDIEGNAVVADLAAMPHLLIAGATGSGKSVCMNTLICSILFKAKPDEVKIIMIDPKKVELAGFAGLPHLGRPVVTNAKKAAVVLKEVVAEMERRYTLFAATGVKNFTQYNEHVPEEKLPQIVVLIDELADLMMVAAHDVEDSICRLAQMARAAGIHLVIATQRPSVDVITGLIKANVPSRIAFAVSSQVDSRTILDMSGAEKLLGRGDMLFYPIGTNKPIRVQGAFIDEDEIVKLVDYCKEQGDPEYLTMPDVDSDSDGAESGGASDMDELFHDAVQQVIMSGTASASFLQRRFRIGYNRAARLIETMEQLHIVSPMEGTKRQILMTWEQFTELYGVGE